MTSQAESKLLFSCYVEVPRHSSKKNEKVPFRNKGTGKFFVGKSSKAKFAEDWLTQKLIIAKLKNRIDDPIDCDIHARFTFYFPESVYNTKKGVRSQKLPDLSNLYELPQDCLQKTKIIANDTLIISHDGSRRVPIDGPKYFLKIELFQESFSFTSLVNKL